MPMACEVVQMCQRVCQADKAVLFMHNSDIDMLYSLAMGSEEGNQQFGQFGINSIRIKSNVGLAGKVSSSFLTFRHSPAVVFVRTKACL